MTNGRTRAGIGRIALWVVCASVAAMASAQSTERPEWSYGDRWLFRQHTTPPPTDSQWSRRVVDPMPSGGFRVETEDGKYPRFDREGNSLDRRGPEYTWRRFDFPLTLGKTWQHERKIDGGTEKSSWKVVAFEKITVPAGAFDCFRVEGEAFKDWSGVATVGKSFWKGYTKTTYWYCPAVKWAARWEIEDVAYVTAPRVVTVSELVSFEQQH